MADKAIIFSWNFKDSLFETERLRLSLSAGRDIASSSCKVQGHHN